MVVACKPSVWGWLAPEVCCEGGPQPAHLPRPGNDFSKRGRRGGPQDRQAGGGGRLHVYQGRAALLDVKCARKNEALVRQAAVEWQVRKQPNTCQILLGRCAGPGRLGSGPPLAVCARPCIYGFHMCCFPVLV